MKIYCYNLKAITLSVYDESKFNQIKSNKNQINSLIFDDVLIIRAYPWTTAVVFFLHSVQEAEIRAPSVIAIVVKYTYFYECVTALSALCINFKTSNTISLLGK